MNSLSSDDVENPKVKKDTRELILKQVDREPSKKGLTVDTRSIKIAMDPTCMWYFKYDQGLLPQVLQQKFTTFEKAYKHAEKYFGTRGVSIEKVID